MKVSELEGAQLDYWVAKSLGGYGKIVMRVFHIEKVCGDFMIYRPSTDWSQGGPIIEREKISVVPFSGLDWGAYIPLSNKGKGPTPLIAAMRCYVASKFGDEVPDE